MKLKLYHTFIIFFIFSSFLTGQYKRTIPVDKVIDSIKITHYLKRTQVQKKNYSSRAVSTPFKTQNPNPKDDNVQGAQASRIDLIRDTGLNLQGENLAVAMWETGRTIDHHPDFYDDQTPPVTRIERLGSYDNDTSHAIAVAGVLASSGENDNNAKGMAPKAKVRSYSTYNASGSFNTADYITSIEQEISNGSSILANNSWGFDGGYRCNTYNASGNCTSWKWGEASGANAFQMTEDYIFGFYSSFDLEIDALLDTYQNYNLIFSAGNDKTEYGGINDYTGTTPYPADCSQSNGYDCIAWGHNAKNIIVVGAINETLDFEKSSDITLANFSSVGPTDDGRIKPDVVAVGQNMYTTSTSGSYTKMNGTSFSAPIVSGGSLLIQEHAKNVLGNTLLGFTLKGLITNTAGELGNYMGPDYHYGWGLFDAKGATDFLSNTDTSTFIAEDVLSNNETKTYYFAPKLDRITATLSWYDPEGTPVFDFSTSLTNQEAQDLLLNNRTSMLINDLDLRLENASAIYEPWKLDVLQPSNPPVRGDNTVDNVEEVYIHTDELKQGIIKATISHKGTLKDGLDEHYALLINGVQEITCNIYDGTSWSIKTPDSTDECLIFEGDYTVQTDDVTLTAPYVQIEKGSVLTINNRKTLTINGSLTNNGSVIVKPLATLKVQ